MFESIMNNTFNLRLLFVILFLLTVLPLLLFKYPILVDYHNHLANFYIYANIENDPFLQENYGVSWGIRPSYTILEWLAGMIAGYINIYTAGKLILFMGMLFIGTGTLLIRKQINGCIDYWILILFLFLYNYVLYYGFINYYISSGLVLLAILIWIKLRRINVYINLLIFSLIALFLFFCHLFAFGIYAVFVVSYEMGVFLYFKEKFSLNNTAKALAQFICPFIYFIIWIVNRSKNYNNDFYNYGTIQEKIISFLSFINYDLNIYSLEITTITLLFVLIIKFYFHTKISIYNNMKLPLLFIGLLSIFMPKTIAGAWGVDFRIPFIFMLLFVASVKFDENSDSEKFKKSIAILAIIAVCLKIYFISDSWGRIGRQYQEFDNALHYINKGSKIITIQDNSQNEYILDKALYHHMSALAVIERSVFWPNLFSNPITPITSTEKTKKIDSPLSGQLTLADLLDKTVKNGDFYRLNAKVYWENWTQDFDYLISIRFDNTSVIDLKNLKLIFRGSFFDIYRIIY